MTRCVRLSLEHAGARRPVICGACDVMRLRESEGGGRGLGPVNMSDITLSFPGCGVLPLPCDVEQPSHRRGEGLATCTQRTLAALGAGWVPARGAACRVARRSPRLPVWFLNYRLEQPPHRRKDVHGGRAICVHICVFRVVTGKTTIVARRSNSQAM